MSDALWGAIIALAGTLIGAIVTGIVTYYLQKKEREARLEELSIQIQHKENESRRDRLIEDRKRYLPKLREAVSSWKVQLANMINKIDSLGKARLLYDENSFLGYYFKPDYKSYENDFNEIKSKMDSFKGEILALRGETSDTELGDLIDTILHQEITVSLNSWPVLRQFFNKFLNEEEKKGDIETALETIRKTASELEKCLQRASKRIEVLSIGDESK